MWCDFIFFNLFMGLFDLGFIGNYLKNEENDCDYIENNW